MATQNSRQPVGKKQVMMNPLSTPTASAPKHPMVPLSPSMLTSIKSAPKGKIPPGLAKYMATHKKGGK